MTNRTSLTDNMAAALTELVSGNHNHESDRLEHWDARTMGALESRGMIEIRDIDGYMRSTSLGYQAAHSA